MKIRLISGHFLFCQDFGVPAVLFLSSHQTQFPTLSDSRSGSFPAISFQLSYQTYFLPCLSSSFMFPPVFLAIGLNFPALFSYHSGTRFFAIFSCHRTQSPALFSCHWTVNFSQFFLAIALNSKPFLRYIYPLYHLYLAELY